VLGSISAVAPPPPSPPPAPVVTPSRVQVGGQVQAAKLIRQVVPEYPKLAHEARLGGVVRLKAVIAKDGTIEGLSVISGHPLLVPAAMTAVKQWIYKPTFLNGVAIEVDTEIDVTFALST
jgi:protein TonB